MHFIDNGVPPNKILGLTFSTAATKEMKQRIKKVLPLEQARQVMMRALLARTLPFSLSQRNLSWSHNLAQAAACIGCGCLKCTLSLSAAISHACALFASALYVSSRCLTADLPVYSCDALQVTFSTFHALALKVCRGHASDIGLSDDFAVLTGKRQR